MKQRVIKGNAQIEFPKMGVTINMNVTKTEGKDGEVNVSVTADGEPAPQAAINVAPQAPTDTDAVCAKKRKTYAEIAAEATAKSGVGYICLGNGTFARQKEDGSYEVVTDDPIIKSISEGGALWNARIFKQHVLAQTLAKMEKGHYNEEISKLSYEYMLKVMLDMAAKMCAMWHENDPDLWKTERWYSKELFCDVINNYAAYLRIQIYNGKVRKCKGRPYYTIAGVYKVCNAHRNMVFADDIDRKVIKPYKDMADIISLAHNPGELHEAFKRFYKQHIKLDIKTSTPESLRDAYKGYGAYWSLQNLIMFHGCVIREDMSDDALVLSGNEAMKHLDSLLKYGNCCKKMLSGWWFTGLLKCTIKDNGINISEFRKTWRR